jgi:hypothetical protein
VYPFGASVQDLAHVSPVRFIDTNVLLYSSIRFRLGHVRCGVGDFSRIEITSQGTHAITLLGLTLIQGTNCMVGGILARMTSALF